MKNLYLIIAVLISSNTFGQIEQNVNKTSGTATNAINDIDSIRFNASQTEMQIILNNGSAFIHAIGDVNNVTFSGNLIGSITSLNCASATNNGTLTAGVLASGVSSEIPYSGGNGGTHNGQTVNSTGVTGLTATLNAGTFATGAGTLTYTITGTPSAAGTASFALNIGGKSCTLAISVKCLTTPTAVVDVFNPSTGATWMDRNLGATQVATTSTDANSYGDLYQWGRFADGHQCRTSPTTSTLSSTDQPGHGEFIIAHNYPWDWRSPQNTNLWQGVNGVNNPCPSGYRLPTETELNAERLSWSTNNAAGAFASPLKLPVAGYRNSSDGSLYGVGTYGGFWSSTVSSANSHFLDFFLSGSAFMSTDSRAYALSVRCIKN